jgi:hypothetical protein
MLKKLVILIYLVFSIYFIFPIKAENIYKQTLPPVVLELGRVYDERLPVLSDNEVKEVLKIAESFISSKFSPEIKISFHDNGVMPINDFFNSVSYKTGKLYEFTKNYKYDFNLGEKMPIFNDPSFKKNIAEFLTKWDLNSLKTFLPGYKIETYIDAADSLIKVYHQKMHWQKSIRLAEGSSLIISPPVPWQSYVEWLQLMYLQDKFDIVITNSFISYDYLGELEPHAITRHAKIGGSGFQSINRKSLFGKSLMINIFQNYGGVNEFKENNSIVTREIKNRILATYYVAHEFGHAFYLLPDVYDHGPSCIMNSKFNMSDEDGYNELIAHPAPCGKCKPAVDARLLAYKAYIAFLDKDYATSGNLYLEAAEKYKEISVRFYGNVSKSLCLMAKKSFLLNNNSIGAKKADKLQESLTEFNKN